MQQNKKDLALRITKDMYDDTAIVAMTDPESGDTTDTGLTVHDLRDLLKQTEHQQAGIFDHSWAQTVQNVCICIVIVGGLMFYRSKL